MWIICKQSSQSNVSHKVHSNGFMITFKQTQQIMFSIKICFIENYEQNKNLIENMICCVCLNVIIKPFECTLCETLICEDCLQIIQIAGKKMCPNKMQRKLPKSKQVRQRSLIHTKNNMRVLQQRHTELPRIRQSLRQMLSL